MRETPRQPKTLESGQEGILAFLGNRIELWNSLKYSEMPLEEKIRASLQKTARELLTVRERDDENARMEQALLEDDIRTLRGLVDSSEKDFEEVCDDQADFYKERRARFVTELNT